MTDIGNVIIFPRKLIQSLALGREHDNSGAIDVTLKGTGKLDMHWSTPTP